MDEKQITEPKPEVVRDEFLKELRALLGKYKAEITATDHWQGYPECGQNVRMTVDFDDYRIGEIDLGACLDSNNPSSEG